MQIVFALSLMLLLSSQVQAAEPPDWLYPALKVDNPNELAVLVFATDKCFVTTEELTELVSGVLIRSRVKPLLGYEYYENDLYLKISMQCNTPKIGHQVYTMDAIFGNYNVTPPVRYPSFYGFLGDARKPFIVSRVKNMVEVAITDYIKANFNL
jgi:hypothetical protein